MKFFFQNLFSVSHKFFPNDGSLAVWTCSSQDFSLVSLEYSSFQLLAWPTQFLIGNLTLSHWQLELVLDSVCSNWGFHHAISFARLVLSHYIKNFFRKVHIGSMYAFG